MRLDILLLLLVFASQTMADQSLTENFARKLAVFAVNIYSSIVLQKPEENVVISPLSIQTCVAMARVGAEHQTAIEIDRGLGLSSVSLEDMAEGFHNILKTYEQSDVLKIANKIYVDDKYKLGSNFSEILSKKFLSDAQSINFKDKSAAAANINNWVEQRTNNLIKNLVSEDDLGDAIRVVLINAIHFKGQWRTKFRKDLTGNEDFYINENVKIQVPMMHATGKFRYAHRSDLSAAVLEMPYENSDLSMLVILPDSRTGLKTLEEKLKNIGINDIVENLSSEHVIISLPKFKTEFSLELTDSLKKLGITRMFSKDAEFGYMINPQDDINVSKVIHKAFIEVNEEGTEAAAATGFLVMPASAHIQVHPKFKANHPFMFILKNIENIPLYTGRFHH